MLRVAVENTVLFKTKCVDEHADEMLGVKESYRIGARRMGYDKFIELRRATFPNEEKDAKSLQRVGDIPYFIYIQLRAEMSLSQA